MKNLLFAFLLMFSLAIGASGQTLTGQLSVASSTCGAAVTSSVVLYQSQGTSLSAAAFAIAGTWSGTVTFYATANRGATWTAFQVTPSAGGAGVTTATGNGNWSTTAGAYNGFCAAFTTATSGTASVTITLSTGGGSGGGGSGAITGCSTSGALLYENGTANTATCDANNTWSSSAQFQAVTGSVIANPTPALAVSLGGAALNGEVSGGAADTGNNLQGVFGLSAPTISSTITSAVDIFGVLGNSAPVGAGSYSTNTIVAGIGGEVDDDLTAGNILNSVGVWGGPTVPMNGGTATNTMAFYATDQAGVGTTLNAAYYSAAQTAGAHNWSFYDASAANKDFFGALTAASVTCGVLNTTSCVLTGYGSTSGTATCTWPAVAGTVTNPIACANTWQAPVFNATSLKTAYQINGETALIFPGADTNSVAVGYESLPSQTGVNQYNTGVGQATLFTLTSGVDNTAVGWESFVTGNGSANTGVGYLAGDTNTGSDNTMVGFQAGSQTGTGSDNTAIGYDAMNSAGGNRLSGGLNTAVGESAMVVLQGAATENTAVGMAAGSTLTTGTTGVYLGYNTQPNGVADTNEIALGSSAAGAGSNTAVIGNSSVTDAYFGGSTSGNANIHGKGYYTGATAGISSSGVLCTATFTSVLGLVTACTAVSDPRLKVLTPYTLGLDRIEKLNPILFHYNDLGMKITGTASDANVDQVGFSAKNVQEAMPEAVGTETHDGADYLSLPWGDRPIVAALVNAVKEQQSEIDSLKQQIESLQSAIKGAALPTTEAAAH